MIALYNVNSSSDHVYVMYSPTHNHSLPVNIYCSVETLCKHWWKHRDISDKRCCLILYVLWNSCILKLVNCFLSWKYRRHRWICKCLRRNLPICLAKSPKVSLFSLIAHFLQFFHWWLKINSVEYISISLLRAHLLLAHSLQIYAWWQLNVFPIFSPRLLSFLFHYKHFLP